jgi:hypothetical protein
MKTTLQLVDIRGRLRKRKCRRVSTYFVTIPNIFKQSNPVSYDDQGMRLVNRSIELGQPVIYAAMNYR